MGESTVRTRGATGRRKKREKDRDQSEEGPDFFYFFIFW